MAEPLTKADAEALGYTFEESDPTHVVYSKDGEVAGSAEGDTPLFAALASIAEREERGFAQGYGGDLPITTELVLQTSGESYTVPPDELAYQQRQAEETKEEG